MELFSPGTHVPCMGRQILNHWTTKEVLSLLTKCDNLQVHLCYCKWLYFILFNSRIIFHCIYVSHLYPFIWWWTFRLLLCLGCCISAAVNTGVHYPSESCFSPVMCPVLGLLDHMVALFSFLRNLHTVQWESVLKWFPKIIRSYNITVNSQRMGSKGSVTFLLACYADKWFGTVFLCN